MNQRQIGIILIVIGIFSALFVLFEKSIEEKNIKIIADKTGSCYLEDGTCLHNQSQYMVIFGSIIAASLAVLGFYLIFFDRTQNLLAKQNKEVSSALHEAKRKDEFNAFLSAFSAEEQLVLKTIKENEGITQSTLRFKVGMSKAYISMLLSELEQKDIISRKSSGKTYEIFLRKKF